MAVAVADCSGYTETLLQNTDQFNGYSTDVNEALAIATSFLDSDDWKNKSGGWKMENIDKTTGDIVYSIKDEKLGKVFSAVAEFHQPELTVEKVFDELYHRVHNVPKWHAGILEIKPVLEIGKQTDLLYTVFADVLGGLVSGRDFLDVRGWRKTGDYIDFMSKSVEHKDHGEKKGRIRAYKSFANARITKTGKDTVTVTWIHQIDMKGMLPQSLVDRSAHCVLLTYLKLFRQHLQQLKKS